MEIDDSIMVGSFVSVFDGFRGESVARFRRKNALLF